MHEAMNDKHDFLQPLLDMMTKRMDTLETKLDSNSATTQQILEQAQKTNGRVTKSEKAIMRLESHKGGLKFNFSPALTYMVALGAVILLVIIASLLHVNLGGLVK